MKAKIENGQPRITPTAATATAKAGFPSKNNPDERLMAYIENELGKKPANHIQHSIDRQNEHINIQKINKE
jgi:hypothetical protein